MYFDKLFIQYFGKTQSECDYDQYDLYHMSYMFEQDWLNNNLQALKRYEQSISSGFSEA